MATRIPVLVSGDNETREYRSLRATSRTLSGTGTDGVRGKITRRVYEGGGLVGNVYVEPKYRSFKKR